MTSPNDQLTRDSSLNTLKVLSTLQPPEGMQERIAEHIRQHQIQSSSRGLGRYAWELGAGASIAALATAVILCVFVLQAHRAAGVSVAANLPLHPVVSAPATTKVQPAPLRKIAHAYRVKPAAPEAPIPHTPPPQPLTEQERLLVALANTPSLLASLTQSQTISEHGLGPNAIFELDHEQLQPMSSESRLVQPLPQNLP